MGDSEDPWFVNSRSFSSVFEEYCHFLVVMVLSTGTLCLSLTWLQNMEYGRNKIIKVQAEEDKKGKEGIRALIRNKCSVLADLVVAWRWQPS